MLDGARSTALRPLHVRAIPTGQGGLRRSDVFRSTLACPLLMARLLPPLAGSPGSAYRRSTGREQVPDSEKGLGGKLAPRREALIDVALTLVLAAFLAQAVYYLALGFGRPIFEQHGFRQTQTALSTYWILQGGPWIAYETPVLGAPWALPFEFPTYQLAAAA